MLDVSNMFCSYRFLIRELKFTGHPRRVPLRDITDLSSNRPWSSTREIVIWVETNGRQQIAGEHHQHSRHLPLFVFFLPFSFSLSSSCSFSFLTETHPLRREVPRFPRHARAHRTHSANRPPLR